MNWDDAACVYYKRTFPHGYQLSFLPAEWQRELVALYLAGRDINNGGYLQFFANHDQEVHRYASLAHKSIGAPRMAALVDSCQALIEEHTPPERGSWDLFPNEVLAKDGSVLKPRGSVLPDAVLDRLRQLSYEYMEYPESVGDLARKHYGPLIAVDKSVG